LLISVPGSRTSWRFTRSPANTFRLTNAKITKISTVRFGWH